MNTEMIVDFKAFNLPRSIFSKVKCCGLAHNDVFDNVREQVVGGGGVLRKEHCV
jgi:hypothetical protein